MPDHGVILFVGPNNAGKSQSLRDIQGLARAPEYVGKSIIETKSNKTGSYDDAVNWADDNLQRRVQNGSEILFVPGWGEISSSAQFAAQWGYPNLNVLTDLFMLFADGTTRLTAGNAQQNIDFRTQYAQHPIQRAARFPEIEAQFDLISRSAFGLPLTIDRYSGSVIPVRVGPRPTFEHDEGRPSESYLTGLQILPQLEEQGDGVKSFMGLMMQLVAGSQDVLLVDEPEAFLHPPQARHLGKLLAERSADRQVIISTHSSDVVQGALEANHPVTIVRLTRTPSGNAAAVLDHTQIETLWADPLLKYSKVLEGLFHDAVVLCESDSDCRYYSAVRDGLFPEQSDERRVQILFTHCGGKARLPVVVNALSALRVPVVVVSDFDILREESDAKRTYEALGGNWADVKSDRDLVDRALQNETRPLRKTATLDALREALQAAPEVLVAKDIEILRAILKAENGWDKAKRSGLAGLPQGDAAAAGQRCLDALERFLLLVVPVGEIERFVPSVGGHGPAWTNSVLSNNLHLEPSNLAEAFVRKIEASASRLRM